MSFHDAKSKSAPLLLVNIVYVCTFLTNSILCFCSLPSSASWLILLRLYLGRGQFAIHSPTLRCDTPELSHIPSCKSKLSRPCNKNCSKMHHSCKNRNELLFLYQSAIGRKCTEKKSVRVPEAIVIIYKQSENTRISSSFSRNSRCSSRFPSSMASCRFAHKCSVNSTCSL